MSTYYDFYLGTKVDGKFKALAPFIQNKEGEISYKWLYSRSSSFIGDIKDEFDCTTKQEEIDESLYFIAKQYGFINDELVGYKLNYLPYSEIVCMANSGGMKRAYVLKDAVNNYELYGKENYTFDDYYQYEVIAPIVYAEMNEQERDKYMLYTWYDYTDKSYAASEIVSAAELVKEWYGIYSDKDLYIFMEIC